MNTWRKFLALSGDDRLFLAEASALLMLVWLGLRILPFMVLRRLLDRYAGQSDAVLTDPATRPAITCTVASATRVIDRIAWAVTVVADRCPGRTITCLVRALAVDTILKRYGHASDVRMGVRLAPFEAHVWVECKGRVVIGQLENLSDYAVLSAPVCS